MPRGGNRRGKGGVAYTNRTDLNAGPRTSGPPTQPIRVATGQAYGQAGAQRAALQALPLPQAAAPQPIPLDAPTQRPGEPITHGLPIGPGAGPEVLGPMPQANEDPTVDVYRELYKLYPNADLQGLIEQSGLKQ